MINRGRVVIVTDDPVMAAVLSGAFARPGQYVPVYESPRMQRPDIDNEITALINSMRRVGVGSIIYSRVDPRIPKQVAKFIDATFFVIDKFDDLDGVAEEAEKRAANMTNENAAVELYRQCSPTGSRNKLAVIIANTNEVDSVIAANYAVARNADFYMINTPQNLKKSVVEKLNRISASGIDVDIRKIDMKQLREDLTAMLPTVDLSKYSKILFVSDGIPFGIAVPEVATAHLPKLRLGISIASNLGEYVTATQRRHAFNGTILINRDLDTKKEETAMSAAMLRTQGLVKTETLKHAQLSELAVEIFPYDVLYIATHGSQILASRETYDFKTGDGTNHEIIVDVGRGTTGEVHYIFSVDSIEKTSAEWTKSHGEVWGEYQEKVIKQRMPISPIKKPESVLIQLRELQFEPHKNGMGSGTALNSLAGGYSPLVIVNACGSWNEICVNFVYAGCTAFIGTLLPVLDSTAASYGEAFFENLFKEELINVAYEARMSLPDEYDQSLYVYTGTFESKFDFASSSDDPNGIEVLQKRIPIEIDKIKARINELNGKERRQIIDTYKAHAYYLEYELEQFNEVVRQANKKN